MDIRIDKTNLVRILQMVQGIVERRTTIPILANILIEAKAKQIEVKATDLEVFIRARCDATVKEEGGITLGARKLFEIVKELPEGEVEMTTKDGGRINIRGGKARFSIVGMPTGEFPSFPSYNEELLSPIEPIHIREMIDKTVFAASTDETRHNMNGVFFEKEGDKVKMVATDGHRLALVERGGGEGLRVDRGVIIPRKGVLELMRLLDEKQGGCAIGFTGNMAILKREDTVFITRLIDGEFPDYKQVIPKGNERIVTINRERLLGALRRVSLLSPERIRAVRFNLSKERLELFSNNPDLGEAREEIEVDYKGEGMEIGFNARYIMDALEVMRQEEVILELKDQLSPALLKPFAEEGYLYIVMPVRI
ncbi:MAG: DNA polymerase III subunit beta [Deltaproteobacteria bacterium]|nr:DNA polymerase III subunit beta [Deltaproteobacteria bacterium]